MTEREKVIRGLECWLNDDTHCPDDDCPYMGPLICDQTAILNDAITILKAHDVPETNVGKWISVKDRLPEERINPNTNDFEYVLCATTFGDVRAYKYGMIDGNIEAHFWHGFGMVDKYITHWMPLPEPPKEET